MADTRRLFDRLVSRKVEWHEMHAIDYRELAPDQQEALGALPVRDVPKYISAFDAHPAFADEPIEKVVRRGDRMYYVNSEGYDYARYGFRIIGWPAAAKPVRFGCGCTYHPEPDENGIAPWLEHCGRHGGAGWVSHEKREG